MKLRPGEGALCVKKLTRETIRNIALDYIVHELSRSQICQKYNVTFNAWTAIYSRMALADKRDEYRKTVMKKAMERLSDVQASAIAKSVKILSKHLDKVDRLNQVEMLDSETVNDVLKVFAHFAKEKRLDEEKPTDNLGITVKVVMPDSMPVIGHTVFPQQPPIEVESSNQPIIQIDPPQHEAKAEEIRVVIDDSLLGAIE